MDNRLTHIQKNTRKAFWVLFLLFFVLVVHFILISTINRKEIASKPMNKRLAIMDNDRLRGSIYTKDGVVLASSIKNETMKRRYNEGTMAAHLVGYVDKARSGVELLHNFTLQELHLEFFQWLTYIAKDEMPMGNSVYLTINSHVQNAIDNFLEAEGNGAIVVMEVKTGKIIGMGSNPTFKPSEVGEKWVDLNNPENTDKPLLNRATSGLYEPGSTGKLLVATAALEKDKEYEHFTVTCQGEEIFGDHKVRCYKGKVHGEVDMSTAMAVSCNLYFAHLGKELGPEILKETADKLLFNTKIEAEFPISQSQFVLNGNSEEAEILDTSFGQGRTLVSPMHMLMITSGIANNGTIMTPIITEKITSKDKLLKDSLSETYATIISSDTANRLKDMMADVVTHGTGTSAKGDISIAGKTGTAENPSGKDHSWFVSFAPVADPKFAICTFLEESGVSNKGQQISKKIYQMLLN